MPEPRPGTDEAPGEGSRLRDLHELSDREYRATMRLLAIPRFRVLAVLAAELRGLRALVAACYEGKLDDKIRAKLEPFGWSERDLPRGDELERILLGVRIVTAASGRRAKLRSAARVLGIPLAVSAAAVRELEGAAGEQVR